MLVTLQAANSGVSWADSHRRVCGTNRVVDRCLAVVSVDLLCSGADVVISDVCHAELLRLICLRDVFSRCCRFAWRTRMDSLFG